MIYRFRMLVSAATLAAAAGLAAAQSTPSGDDPVFFMQGKWGTPFAPAGTWDRHFIPMIPINVLSERPPAQAAAKVLQYYNQVVANYAGPTGAAEYDALFAVQVFNVGGDTCSLGDFCGPNPPGIPYQNCWYTPPGGVPTPDPACPAESATEFWRSGVDVVPPPDGGWPQRLP